MSKRYRLNKKAFARFIVLIVAIIVAAVCITIAFKEDIKSVYYKLTEDNTLETANETGDYDVFGIPVTQKFIPQGYAGRPGIQREIMYIVIHETANHGEGANAESHSRYLMEEAKETEISWHYTVDDHEIYQNLPDNEVGWHAGDRTNEPGGNMNGIGVEICVNDDGDFEAAKDNAAKLTAYLIEKHALGIEAVKQHHDFMDKNCPTIIRDNGQWDDFLERVKEYI